MTVDAYLRGRFFNKVLHKAWINETEQSVTFPMWNLSGQMVGYQRHMPFIGKTDQRLVEDPRFARYFTKIHDGKVAVLGLESWYLSNTLFVTEGYFDACRLTHIGLSAIALTTYTANKSTDKWLRGIVMKTRPTFAICDGPTKGKTDNLKLKKYGHDYLVMPPERDLGGLSDHEFFQTLQKIRDKGFLT